jgi:hypothetical protein
MYIHLNPACHGVAPLAGVDGLELMRSGLGKDDRQREKEGILPVEPSEEQVFKRVETLRKHRWSSYPAYAGYAEVPNWLHCEDLWRRCCDKGEDPKKEYREWIEDYIRQGIEEKTFSKISTAVAIGSVEFIAKIRKSVLKDKGVNTNERAWRRLLPFTDVIAAVEKVKGEPWNDFVNRHGDWGRDLALYVGRLRCGLTLKELGGYTDMKVQAVSQAAMRIEKRLKREKQLCDVYKETLKIIGENED